LKEIETRRGDIEAIVAAYQEGLEKGAGKPVADSATPYDGETQQIGLQSSLPIQKRRTLTREELVEIQEAQKKWLPKIFTSYADPVTADMSSPGKGALISGAAGTGIGAIAGGAMGGAKGATIGGLGLGTLAALLSYYGTKANNAGAQEMMTRLPQGATRRDLRSDPVYSRDMEFAREANERRSTAAILAAALEKRQSYTAAGNKKDKKMRKYSNTTVAARALDRMFVKQSAPGVAYAPEPNQNEYLLARNHPDMATVPARETRNSAPIPDEPNQNKYLMSRHPTMDPMGYLKANKGMLGLGALSGAVGGFALGGGTLWDRIKRALMFGALGAVGGVMAPAAYRSARGVFSKPPVNNGLTPTPEGREITLQAGQTPKPSAGYQGPEVNTLADGKLAPHKYDHFNFKALVP
jgi:hypothetical protein